ncbi:MAG: rod shape-determining protein [Pseudomonadales bacterium]|nr:rod shape-determining protein [Pseudomonadales bacterium]
MNAMDFNIRNLFSKKSNTRELFLDVGSSNTRIYLNDKEIFCEPTCIAYHKNTESVVSVGKKALMLLGKAPKSIEVAFPVQHGAVSNTKYLELYLKTILDDLLIDLKFRRLIFGLSGKFAVMSTLSPAKKKLTKNLLKKVGFSKIDLVDSSYLAALSVSSGDKKQLNNICIIDFGAQKTEIAVFSMGELVSSKSFKRGGIQLTEILQKVSRVKHKCVVGWHLAEEAKKQVGAVDSSRNKFALRGKDIVSQASKTVVFSSDDVREEFSEFINDLLDNIQYFISTLPSETAISVLDKGIFLTGGASLLSGLDVAIIKRLKCDVFLSTNPKRDILNGLLLL